MSWENLRDNWQRTATAPLSSTAVKDTMRRARTLRFRILWRDGIESVIALALVPVAVRWMLSAMHAHKSLSAASFALLAALLLYVPWHLWRVRRQLPRSDATLPLARFLKLDRAAMLAQANMHATVARWYLAPVFLIMTGVLLGDLGPTPKAFAALFVVLLICVILDRFNKWVAVLIFRNRVADIDVQSHQLDTMETSTAPNSTDDVSQKDAHHDS